jgi:hypothetical protein
LVDVDKVKKPEAFKKRVFRGSYREIKHLSSISEFDKLSKADQHSVATNRIVLNVIRQQARVRPDEPKKTQIAPQPMVDVTRFLPKKG